VQNRDRFSVVELLMQGLSVGALVLMATVFAVYVGRAATRIPEIVGRQQVEEQRRDARSAAEAAWLGRVDGGPGHGEVPARERTAIELAPGTAQGAPDTRP
jgi:hypothetical protein